MNKLRTKNYQGGQAMLISVVVFLFISTTVVLGMATPILKQVKSSLELIHSKETYYLAEAALEDGLYRVKSSKTIASGDTITLNGSSAVLTITTTSTGKTIDATATVGGRVRKMEATVFQGAGVAFNYGLQSGNGGVTMGGGSTINGNIYSNASINAISATITGSATAADSSALVADQTNDTPTIPPSSITFRNVAASQDLAQSFQLSADGLVNKVQFYIKKVGTPSDATVRIVADNAGTPSTTALPTGSATLSSGLVTTSYGWVDVVLPTPVSLNGATSYWVVIDNSSQSTSNYYVIGSNSTYASGAAKVGAYSGTWTATSTDSYFRVYTGGVSSVIGGATYSTGLMVGTGSVGDVWASTVKGTTAQGHMYCTTGTNNSKVCDTSKGSPSQQALPYSDANIQDWKDGAAAGGVISGNYTVGSAGATIGPKEITGNLLVNGGGTLTLTGPLWVVGTVTVTSGGKIVLPSSYANSSETIISDNTVTISGGGSAGSGASGSYLFIVSTSKCPNDVSCAAGSAINISGGAGAIAVNAQNGTVALSGGASINAAVGDSITITGGSTVTYDTGLASPSFVSGPSGGWNITKWQEVQ